MATLYDIFTTSATGTKGVKAVVKAVPSDLAGHLDPGATEPRIVRPDAEAVREALPAHWRKAWDRGRGRFWFPNDGGLAYCAIKNARGHHIGTVYANPPRVFV